MFKNWTWWHPLSDVVMWNWFVVFSIVYFIKTLMEKKHCHTCLCAEQSISWEVLFPLLDYLYEDILSVLIFGVNWNICSHLAHLKIVLRVSDQNGISLKWYIVERYTILVGNTQYVWWRYWISFGLVFIEEFGGLVCYFVGWWNTSSYEI